MQKKSKAPMAIGLAATAAVVTTAAVMMNANHKPKLTSKKIKKGTEKAVRAVGDIVDNIAYYMK